jgi:hypothetical protein
MGTKYIYIHTYIYKYIHTYMCIFEGFYFPHHTLSRLFQNKQKLNTKVKTLQSFVFILCIVGGRMISFHVAFIVCGVVVPFYLIVAISS